MSVKNFLAKTAFTALVSFAVPCFAEPFIFDLGNAALQGVSNTSAVGPFSQVGAKGPRANKFTASGTPAGSPLAVIFNPANPANVPDATHNGFNFTFATGNRTSFVDLLGGGRTWTFAAGGHLEVFGRLPVAGVATYGQLFSLQFGGPLTLHENGLASAKNPITLVSPVSLFVRPTGACPAGVCALGTSFLTHFLTPQFLGGSLKSLSFTPTTPAGGVGGTGVFISVGLANSLSGSLGLSAVPEPATMSLVGGALIALGLIGRKRANV